MWRNDIKNAQNTNLKRNKQTAEETSERSAAHSLKRSVIVKSGLRQNGGSKRINTADQCKESWAFPALQRTWGLTSPARHIISPLIYIISNNSLLYLQMLVFGFEAALHRSSVSSISLLYHFFQLLMFWPKKRQVKLIFSTEALSGDSCKIIKKGINLSSWLLQSEYCKKFTVSS